MSEEKNSSSKYVTVTTSQYRQLDFLRLFKLCKDLNLFNRKRKMPIEYKSTNEDNDDKNSRSSCRRLLRALVSHIFPTQYSVKSNFSNYFVEFPPDMRSALSYININYRSMESSTNPEYIEAVTGYRLISGQVGGFVFPRVPYSIKIHFSPDQRRQYRDVRRAALDSGNNFGDYVWKPAESFYQCAKACLEYKEHWDKYSNLILKVADQHKLEAEVLAEQKKKIRAVPRPSVSVNTYPDIITTYIDPAPRVTEQQVQNTRNEESSRVLAEAVAQSAQTGPRNTQESFNRALQSLLDRRRQQ